MKYLRGYFTAGILAALTYVLMTYAKRFDTLVDMVYPYVTRTLQDYLSAWSGQVSFCLWQLLAVVLGVLVLASLVVVIVMKWSPVQWFGWVLTAFAGIYLLHMLVFGLNYYAGDLADDVRLTVSGYTLGELVEATEYYRDQAAKYAEKVERDAQGNVAFDDFETLAELAGNGFDNLVHKRSYPIFSGSTLPVKKLGWADMYTSMGITGFTFGITGEAAVNPKAPDVSLPFTMCHETCHRMSIASERDANFGAFLAATANKNRQFRYSGYFMAYRYCYNALCTVRTQAAVDAAAQLRYGESELLAADIQAYDLFYASHRSETNTRIADTVNDTYLKTSGESSGIASYGEVCDLLVNWHIQEVVMPSLEVEESHFDPFDETQVDLTGNVNARAA